MIGSLVVSSWATKHKCVAGFFAAFPTPTSFNERAQSPEVVREVIGPLGLFDNRMKGLVSLTNRFLSASTFSVGLEPENKIYGIGQFGVESYALFCKGTRIKANVKTEKALKQYLQWWK